jgi:hypothetical protein
MQPNVQHGIPFMVARIPIVLSQPLQRNAAAIDLIENIVAAAILVPGLDANLVGDIDAIELGSTDYLCLQGHSRDLVLASFLDLPNAKAAWERLKLSGRFIDFSASEQAIRAALRNPESGRKVYYFQLTFNDCVTVLLDQCQKLLDSQRISLVSIQLAPSRPKPNIRPNSQPQSNALPLQSNSQPATSSAPVASTPRREHVNEATQDRGDEDWTALDKLVDDLDAMNI